VRSNCILHFHALYVTICIYNSRKKTEVITESRTVRGLALYRDLTRVASALETIASKVSRIRKTLQEDEGQGQKEESR
jgi:hypothetical protein